MIKVLFACLLGISLMIQPRESTGAQPNPDYPELTSLLTLFSAHALPAGGVRLNWSLEKQSATILQFRVYRGYEDVGHFAVLSEISAHGMDGPADYSVTDTSARPGVSYYYKIASVSQASESVFPVVISATAQSSKLTSGTEKLPVMILPGSRVSLYVREPGRVTLDVLSKPAKSLVKDTLRPGIYEFDVPVAKGKSVTLRLHHENGYTTEVAWPLH